MTISTQTFRFSFTSTGGAVYPYTNKILDETDLTVYVDDVLQTLSTHYTVSGVGESAGGNVTFLSAPTAGKSVLITKDGVQLTQETDYVENDAFPAASHEDALDKLTNICQKIYDYAKRSIKIPITSSLTNIEVETPVAYAPLVWNSTGTGIENGTEVGIWKGDWATLTTYVVGDVIRYASTGNIYYCLVPHKSGTWATDLAAGKWEEMVDVAAVTTAKLAAEAAQTAAEHAQADAEHAQADAEHAQSDAEAAQSAAEHAQSDAEAAQSLAEAAAITAASQAAALKGTSTTSLAIAVASKTFTTQASKQFAAGMWVLATSDADPTNYMHGQVTSYSGTSLVVNVTNIGGSGTKADWTITVSGTRGTEGASPTLTYASAAEITAGVDATKVIASDQLKAAGIVASSGGGGEFSNLAIAASVSSKALTVALKGADGNDPSASNKVSIKFRHATITDGTPVTVDAVADTHCHLSSGSTLGFTAALAGRIYVWAINNAGTIELALSRTADIFPESGLVTTTAEGGAGAADSAVVMYSTTARSNVACRCIGYIEITTGGTAGEWDNAPTKIQIMGAGVKRTGDIIQRVYYSTGDTAGGATTTPCDDTIPAITEGNEVLTCVITATSAINKVLVDIVVQAGINTAQNLIAALFQDAGACLKAISINYPNACQHIITFRYEGIVGTTSASTFRVRIGGGAGTVSINSLAGSTLQRVFGGVAASSITITEVMT